MFPFRKKKSRGQGVTAMVATKEGVAVACVVSLVGQPPILKYCDFIPCASRAEYPAAVKQLSQQYHLANSPIESAVQPGEFHLVMLEKPEVSDEELAQVMRWRADEMLPFKAEDAIIDVFEIPGQRERGRTPLVYVVAAEKSDLQQHIDLYETQGLQINAIDIPELAARNIAALLAEDQHGVALLNLQQDTGQITLTHHRALFLARNLDVGYRSLIHSTQPFSGIEEGMQLEAGMPPEQQRVLDAIVLEVQRSLDYYEGHFAKHSINSLVIAPLPQEAPGMVSYLASALGLQVRMLDMNTLFAMQEPLSHELQAHCFLAIGTALREYTAILQQEQAA